MGSLWAWALFLVLQLDCSPLVRGKCADPLHCYLETVVIPIPDICEDLNGKELCITEFLCQGIFLDSLPSAYVSPTTLDVGVTGLGTFCSGNYKYGRLIEGTATALVNQTDFALSLFVGKEGEIPVSAAVPFCEVSSMVVDVSFSGGLLDDLAGALDAIIEKAFQTLLCSNIPTIVATNVTQFIQTQLDPALLTILNSTASAPPLWQPHYVSWGSSIVSKLKGLLSIVEGLSDLRGFLKCIFGSDSVSSGERGMSRVGRALGGEEGLGLALLQRLFSLGLGPGSSMGGASSSEAVRVPLPTTVVIFQQDGLPKGYNSSVSLTGLQVRGLDTLSSVQVLEPVAGLNLTLRTQAALQNLTVELELQVLIVPAHAPSDPRHTYVEKLRATLSLEEVWFLLDLDVVADQYLLQSYFLDQLGSKACWFSALQQVSISELQLHTRVTQLQAVQVLGSAGELEKDIVALVDNALLLLISPQGFGDLLTDLINGALQGPLRAAFNEQAAASIAQGKQSAPCLTHLPYDDQTDYIVWADSSLVTAVDYLVNDLLGYQGVNEILTCATNGTGAVTLNTSVVQVQLAGLNSFYALQLLAPSPATASDGVLAHPYDLENLVSLGFCPLASSAACNPFELLLSYSPQQALKQMQLLGRHAADLGYSRQRTSAGSANAGGGSKLTGVMAEALSTFGMELRMSNLSLYLDAEVRVDKDVLRDTQYGQMGTLGCVGASVGVLALKNVSLSLTDAELLLQGGQQRNVTRFLSGILSLLGRSSKLAEINERIAQELSIAETTCAAGGVPPTPVPDEPTSGDDGGGSLAWQWELFIVVVGCLSSLLLLMAAYNYWGRLDVSGGKMNGDADNEEAAEGAGCLWEKYDFSHALIFHKQIPAWVRWSIPLVLLGDVALFINSNLTPDAVSVMVKVVLGPKVIEPGSVFDFGLGNTVLDMWNAKVYPLAILILFFSGAWPYIKLLAMLAAWTVPPKLLNVSTRESTLVVLDVLGKWSLIDFFVMVLMLCAFYFELFIGKGISVYVTVLPKWGFYSFLLATMVSLGIGHIILACHRLVVEPKVLLLREELCPRESLASLVYEVQLTREDVLQLHKGGCAVPLCGAGKSEEDEGIEEGEEWALVGGDALRPVSDPRTHTSSVPACTMLVTVTHLGTALVTLVLLTTALFVLAGTLLDTMGFEFKGMVGLLLKDQKDVNYSLTTVGTSIPYHSGTPHSFAVRWMQASFFLFGQAMPLATLLACALLWLVPLTLQQQRSLMVLAEVCNAWSALDVFCIAIAAALLEIQQFVIFIVGDSCDAINVLLAEYLDPLLGGDDVCFDVVATLGENCWVIFVAAALLIVVVLPLLAITNAAVKRRLSLSAQAEVLHMHMSLGTASPSMKELLRSISREALSRDGKSNSISVSGDGDRRSETRALQRLGLGLDLDLAEDAGAQGAEGELLDPLLPADATADAGDDFSPSAPPERDSGGSTPTAQWEQQGGKQAPVPIAEDVVAAEQTHSAWSSHRLLLSTLRLLERAWCVQLQYVSAESTERVYHPPSPLIS